MSILLVSAASSVPSTHLNYGVLLSNLLYMCVASTLMGIAGGLLISYSSRQMRSMFATSEHSSAAVVILLFFSNYVVYLVAELCEISAILAIFVTGVMCGHYAKHNLTEE